MCLADLGLRLACTTPLSEALRQEAKSPQTTSVAAVLHHQQKELSLPTWAWVSLGWTHFFLQSAENCMPVLFPTLSLIFCYVYRGCSPGWGWSRLHLTFLVFISSRYLKAVFQTVASSSQTGTSHTDLISIEFTVPFTVFVPIRLWTANHLMMYSWSSPAETEGW